MGQTRTRCPSVEKQAYDGQSLSGFEFGERHEGDQEALLQVIKQQNKYYRKCGPSAE